MLFSKYSYTVHSNVLIIYLKVKKNTHSKEIIAFKANENKKLKAKKKETNAKTENIKKVWKMVEIY